MNFTVRMDDQDGIAQVHVSGDLDVHSATEFSQLVHHLSEAAGGRACYDLTAVVVLDDAGRMALRTFVRDTAEYGGSVVPPSPEPCV